MAETPARRIRIEDDLWDDFSRIAKDNGETTAGRIRRMIAEDVKEHQK